MFLIMYMCIISPDSGLSSGPQSTIQSPAFKKITVESPSVLRYSCTHYNTLVTIKNCPAGTRGICLHTYNFPMGCHSVTAVIIQLA